MSQDLEVLNYVDSLTEERDYCSFYLSEQSKINLFIHPFKTLGVKFKLKKLDSVDSEFKMVVASCLNKDDYRKKVKTFITSHPITPYRKAIQ